MPFQDDPNLIRWRLHLRTSPIDVHRLLSTDAGRARFWAESAIEHNGAIDFVFPNGFTWRGRILANDPPQRFSVEYIDHSTATFELAQDGHGGTDLTLTDANVPDAYRAEVIAGWVSLLMALKATWDQGFIEN